MAAEAEGSNFVEDSAINIPPIEGFSIAIGDLWNCRTSELLGRNIFLDSELDEEYLEACPSKQCDYDIYLVKTTADKREAFHISAEISFDLMAGSLKVGGGASFDKSSTEEFNAEEILCTYKLLTYLIRTRAAIREHVDEVRKNEIISGHLPATHYISGIQLGASVAATLNIRKNLSESLFDLKGSFEGGLMITPIPVNIGIKVGLGWLDNSGSSTYSKTIEVISLPPLNGDIPNTVDEMFKKIESIDEEIRKEEWTFPPFDGQRVFGVPVGFTLRPVSELFRTGQPPLYKVLEENLKQDFLNMLLTLQDFKGPNFVTSSLYRMYNPLAILLVQAPAARQAQALGDGGDKPTPTHAPQKNPLVEEILAYEDSLSQNASQILDEGLNLMIEYRKDEASASDLAGLLLTYQQQFDKFAIEEDLRQFCSRGRSLLLAVHAQDVEANTNVLFLKTKEEMGDWLREVNTGVKLLLQTANPGVLTSKIYADLFSVSEAGIQGLLQVGLAYPNISEGSSLSFHYDVAESVVYLSPHDIQFALSLLLSMTASNPIRLVGVGVGPNHSEGEPDQLRTYFYRLYRQFKNERFEVELNSFDSSYFRPFQLDGIDQVVTCETYLQLLEALSTTSTTKLEVPESEWNFVLPIQAVESAFEQIRIYLKLRTFLIESLSQNNNNNTNSGVKFAHKWIAGYFNTPSVTGSPSPHLFVFHGVKLVAICLDNLDLDILQHELYQFIINSTSSMENGGYLCEILSHGNVRRHCIYNVHASVGLRMIEFLSNEQNEQVLSPIPPPPSFQPPTESEQMAAFVVQLDEAREISRILSLNNILALVAHLTNKVLRAFTGLQPLFIKYAKGKWSPEHGWIGYMEEAAEWDEFQIQLTTFRDSLERETLLASKCLQVLHHEVERATVRGKRVNHKRVCRALSGFMDESKAAMMNSQLLLTIVKFMNELNLACSSASSSSEQLLLDKYTQLSQFLTQHVTVTQSGDSDEIHKYYGKLGLDSLIEAVESISKFIAEGRPPAGTLADICLRYVREIKDEAFIEEALPELENGLRQGLYFYVCHVLAKYQYNGKLVRFHKQLSYLSAMTNKTDLTQNGSNSGGTTLEVQNNNANNANQISSWDLSRLREIISWMEAHEEFSLGEREDIWQNPKWVYWLTQGSSSATLTQLIKLLHVNKNQRQRIPKYLPDFLVAKLSEELLLGEEEAADTATAAAAEMLPAEGLLWTSLAELIDAFQRVFTKNFLPTSFNQMLLYSLCSNDELAAELEAAGALRYWNPEDRLFDEPWDLATVTASLPSLIAYEAQAQSSSSSNSGCCRPAGAAKASQNFHRITKLAKQPFPSQEDIPLRLDYSELVAVTGGSLPWITAYEITQSLLQPCLLLKPHIEPTSSATFEQAMSTLLPFILQKLKFHNCSILYTKELGSMINYPWYSSLPVREGQIDVGVGPRSTAALTASAAETAEPDMAAKNFHVGRDDIWACLFCCAEPQLLSYLLQDMYYNYKPTAIAIALPLLCPELVQGSSFKYRCALPLYKQQLPSPSSPLTERVIVCLRHYNNDNNEVPPPPANQRLDKLYGKSSILNQLITRATNADGIDNSIFTSLTKETFHIGQSIGRKYRNVFVEFIRLDEKVTNPDLWARLQNNNGPGHQSEQIILINVHGDFIEDAMELEIPLRWLTSICSPSLLLFWNVNSLAELKEKNRRLHLDLLNGQVKPRFIRHLILNPNDEFSHEVSSENISVDTSQLSDKKTVEVVHTVFEETVRMTRVSKPFLVVESASNQFPSIHFLTTAATQLASLSPPQEVADRLVRFIEMKTVPGIKKLLALARLPPQRDELMQLIAEQEYDDDDDWNELITLITEFLKITDKEYTAWKYLGMKLAELYYSSTAAIRQRLYALQNSNSNVKQPIRMEEHDKLMKDLDRNFLSLEQLLSPIIELHAELRTLWCDYFKLGEQATFMNISLNCTTTTTAAPPPEKSLLAAAANVNVAAEDEETKFFHNPLFTHYLTEFDPNAKIFVLSVIGFCNSEKYRQLFTQLFGGGGEWLNKETKSWPSFPNRIQLRCFDLRAAAAAAAAAPPPPDGRLQRKYDMVILIEWDGQGQGQLGSSSSNSPGPQQQLIMTQLLAISHLTLISYDTGNDADNEWTRIEQLLEIPLASIPEAAVELANGLEINPNLLFLTSATPTNQSKSSFLTAKPISDDDDDGPGVSGPGEEVEEQWQTRLNEKMLLLLDNLKEFKSKHVAYRRPPSSSTSSYSYAEIEDRAYQNTLFQDMDNAEGLHELIFGTSAPSILSGRLIPTSTSTTAGSWSQYSNQFWSKLLRNDLVNTNRYPTLSAYKQVAAIQSELATIKGFVDEMYLEHEEFLNSYLEEEFTQFQNGYPTDDNEESLALQPVLERVTESLYHQLLLSCTNPAADDDEPSSSAANQPCDSCMKLVVAQEEFLQQQAPPPEVLLQPLHVLLHNEITVYLNWIRQYIWLRVVQSCRAIEINTGRSDQLDKILHDIWHSHSHRTEEGSRMESRSNELAWTEFRRFISKYNFIISPQRYLSTEIAREYSEIPWILKQLPLTNGKLPDLTTMKPPFFEQEPLSKFYYDSPFRATATPSSSSGQLRWIQIKWLQINMQEFVSSNLDYEWNTRLYHFGMIRQVKVRAEVDIISKFEAEFNVRLVPKFKWTLHLAVLCYFQMQLSQYYEDEWNFVFSPTVELEKKKNIFPNIFSEIITPPPHSVSFSSAFQSVV